MMFICRGNLLFEKTNQMHVLDRLKPVWSGHWTSLWLIGEALQGCKAQAPHYFPGVRDPQSPHGTQVPGARTHPQAMGNVEKGFVYSKLYIPAM